MSDSLEALRRDHASAEAEYREHRAKAAAARVEMQRFERAIRILEVPVGQVRAPRASAPRGSQYAGEVLALLAEHGPMSKADISRRIGGPRSRANGVMVQLLRDGRVEETGQIRGRSPMFTLVEAGVEVPVEVR